MLSLRTQAPGGDLPLKSAPKAKPSRRLKIHETYTRYLVYTFALVTTVKSIWILLEETKNAYTHVHRCRLSNSNMHPASHLYFFFYSYNPLGYLGLS